MKRIVSSLLLTLIVTLSLIVPSGVIGQATKATTGRPSSIQQTSDVWPRAYALPSEAHMVIFQPQAQSWEGQKHLVAMAAVSYTKKDAPKPDMGTIKLEADTSVALQERMVKFATVKVTETNFQSLPKEQVQEIVTQIEKIIPAEERILSLDRVISQVDKSIITPTAIPILDRVAESMLAHPEAVFEIAGHTDSVGTFAYNFLLSARRAAAVRDYLIRQGVPAYKMTAVGYGEGLPIAPNATVEGRALNRRGLEVRLKKP